MRLLIPLLMIVCAGVAHAVDTANLNGSVPGNRRITYLYEIDFGAPAQTWTLNISLNTNASTGLAINLIDLDALAASAQANPTAIDTAVVSVPGTASATLNGTYSDVHSFAIEIETAGGTTASDYNGTLTTNVGTISFVTQEQLVIGATGLKLSVGKFAFWDGSVSSGGLIAKSLELDFGPNTHTEFFRLEGIGSNIQKIEFIDTTGGSSTVLATLSNPTAGDVTAVPMTHSGKATLRVNVRAYVGAAGSASWAVNAPSSVTVGFVGDPGGASSKNNKCSTDESSGWGIQLLGLVAALAVLLRPAAPGRAARK
ncbi:MAG: hypothetical protein H6839_17560 [Planctomycetes bacterium]|nr:hypothetical protein [Planctomycetota bacterium]